MTFTDWKRRSPLLVDLCRRFSQAELAAITAACRSAYEAGERQGRKDAATKREKHA